jgi:hypothetical protein
MFCNVLDLECRRPATAAAVFSNALADRSANGRADKDGRPILRPRVEGEVDAERDGGEGTRRTQENQDLAAESGRIHSLYVIDENR